MMNTLLSLRMLLGLRMRASENQAIRFYVINADWR